MPNGWWAIVKGQLLGNIVFAGQRTRRPMAWTLLIMVFTMILITLVTFVVTAAGASQVLFSMEDRAGDDYGHGSITYPLNDVFEPGLFDLRRVHIWHDDDNLYFDVSFSRVTNPWSAPEGFFHQLIDVYVDAEPGGHTKPVASGPGVQFSPDAGWEYRLRIQPWGHSQWLDGRVSPGKAYPVRALLLPDGKTIRGEVPLAIIGSPHRGWRYYVLVGGFDTFGLDHYRSVKETATQWCFGGGLPDGGPQVIDLLDGGSGRRNQKAQLTLKGGNDDPPVLLPVGPGISLPFTWGHLLASLIVLCVLGGIFLALFRQLPPDQAG